MYHKKFSWMHIHTNSNNTIIIHNGTKSQAQQTEESHPGRTQKGTEKVTPWYSFE